jgi:hypothetical protein
LFRKPLFERRVSGPVTFFCHGVLSASYCTPLAHWLRARTDAGARIELRLADRATLQRAVVDPAGPLPHPAIDQSQ